MTSALRLAMLAGAGATVAAMGVAVVALALAACARSISFRKLIDAVTFFSAPISNHLRASAGSTETPTPL